MRIAPIVTNSINNRQNSQNTAFGYGVSIKVNLVKKRGRNRTDGPKRYLDRLQATLLGLKEEFLAIVEKTKKDAQVSEDNMNTIGIKIYAKEDLVPEVAVEVRGIDDKSPIIVSDLSMVGGMSGGKKLEQIKLAVEQKARESAALAKQKESAQNATQSAETFVATA